MRLDSSHVLLAGFVALIAWGIAVRLLPVLWHLANAFFIGASTALLLALLLALSTSRRPLTLTAHPRRPIPAFTAPNTWLAELRRYKGRLRYEPQTLHPSSTHVSTALGEIIDLALRDFVTSWYKSISPTPCFVNEIDKNIRQAILVLEQRLAIEDIVGTIVGRIVPIITDHMHEFDNAERIVRSRALNQAIPESEEVNLATAARYKDGKLHPAASLRYSDTKSPQQEHIRKALLRVLPHLLDESMVRSRVVLVLVKGIVACAVVYPAMQALSDPDTWNQIVEAYGRTALQDRKNVKRMRAALDEHTSANIRKQLPVEIPRLKPHDSERAFERFVRAIRKTKTLADARRFRSQIVSQLAREQEVESQDAIYLRRLEMGKRVLDQKIAKITRNQDNAGEVLADEPEPEALKKPSNWTIADIMQTAAGLSYFMEFMDRQGKMILVQFWVVVDGFRNPLEDDFGDEGLMATITWTNTDRLDIAQIAETYIMKTALNVPKEWQDAVREFLQAGRQASPEQYRSARMAILSAQSAVLEELDQKYLPKFRESDLYYKFLASDEAKAVHRVRQNNKPSNIDTLSLKSIAARPVRAAAVTKTSSHVQLVKSNDLRRAALSSSDIKGLAKTKPKSELTPVRRSLDASTPLFEDDYDTDTLAQSTQSLGNDSNAGDFQEEPEVIESMEAALCDIMAQETATAMSDPESDSLFGVMPPPTRPSLETVRTDSALNDRMKPSLATLGLVNSAGRIGVFQDNDLFGDEEKFAEDEYIDHAEITKNDQDEEIHQAAPGDLGLVEAITALSDDIERLGNQEAVVDSLTRKAELTNNIAELRILAKSKASLQREIRRKELQRQQYIVQESDNSLYGRANIIIESVMVGRDDDGQEYAVYVIKIQRLAGGAMPAASWVVAHRYSEFHELHQQLRRRYPSTRTIDFPRRRMVMKLQKQFLHNRRVALEAWLKQLLRMPDVCRSREFRAFLSQQAIAQPEKNNANATSANAQDMVARLYNSVTDGMDEFLGNMSVLDQLSSAGQNLMSAATVQIDNNGVATSPSNEKSTNDIVIEPGSMTEAEAELRAFEDKELAPFVKPICDIFLEIFQLNRGNNWLRGRAVVVVIQQLLGGTVERKIRDAFNALCSPESILKHIETIRSIMWPLVATNNQGSEERKMRTSPAPRTKLQKDQSRRDAALVLSTLLPELASSVVGRSNAQNAAKRLAAVLNNRRLNEHLMYTILDEVISVLFDDVSGHGMQSSIMSSKAEIS